MVSLKLKVPDGKSAVRLTPSAATSVSAVPPPQAIRISENIAIQRKLFLLPIYLISTSLLLNSFVFEIII